jgi:hypothetical protein
VRYEAARQDGLSEARAQMVDAGYRDTALTEREKLAIELADCWLGFPAAVNPDVAARLLKEFSAAELASMLLALMTFNFTSRTAVSIGGMPEEPLPLMIMPVSASSR